MTINTIKKILKNISFLALIFLASCNQNNNKNVKELTIGCYDVYIKNFQKKSSPPIIHNHKEKKQETMNIDIVRFDIEQLKKCIDNIEEFMSKIPTENIVYQNNKLILECRPTHLKDIMNIQTENEKEEATYMCPNEYDIVTFEGLPAIDQQNKAHSNIFKILKEDGELHIKNHGHHPNCFLNSNNKLVGPFIWKGNNGSITKHETIKFEKIPKDIELPKKNCCNYISDFFKSYIAQPAYNGFTKSFPQYNLDSLNQYCIKNGWGTTFQSGIGPMLRQISYWLSGNETINYKLAHNADLYEHQKNSQEIIEAYFKGLGYKSCEFKYDEINKEYPYEIIVKK